MMRIRQAASWALVKAAKVLLAYSNTGYGLRCTKALAGAPRAAARNACAPDTLMILARTTAHHANLRDRSRRESRVLGMSQARMLNCIWAASTHVRRQ